MGYLIDEDSAAFIQAGRSITLAASDDALRASVAKAVAARVAPGRDELTLYVVRTKAGDLLRDLAASWRLAAVFSQPSTHRTLQLKGRVLAIGPVETAALPELQRQIDELVADMASIGFTPGFTRTFLAFDPGLTLAVRMAPAAGFNQTPGPGAGRTLGGNP